MFYIKILSFFFLIQAAVLCGKEPLALYLTWTHDPTSTMTIQWHTVEGDGNSYIYYQRLKGDVWEKLEASCANYMGSKRQIYTLELQGLDPDSDYSFKIGKNEKVYLFRTMQREMKRPVRFVVGGDVYFQEGLFRKMNAQIAKTDPDFIVIGGDIAYTINYWALFKGKDWEERRWATFFSEWQKSMIGGNGRIIPMLVVLGNHDIRKEAQGVPPFFQLFAMPEHLKAYRALEFGSYLNLIMLDTGHYSNVRGEQTAWLENVLKKEQEGFKIAVYHVGAYPSVYKYNGSTPRAIRQEWVPLFEEYGVDTAFEHHNHAYKRTFRIKEGKVDPEGVQYLGDGSWGVGPRSVNKNLWYMAKSAKINCFWLVTVEEGMCTFESRDIKGRTIEKIASQKPIVVEVEEINAKGR